ncbi:hypothetical protein [Kribbella catacumbae]|uniref:hypothetical protein n=1 Tax=Kribbella catacumbae TaxID=460086 RepID=UPI000379AAEE|nr:hypothetical protein [Kribbella catacumbae]
MELRSPSCTRRRRSFDVLRLNGVDQELAWRRRDQAFFAAGACYILDHHGWTLEEELLACTAEYEPDRPWEIIPIPADLATFCATMAHRLPDQYYADPRPRARAYLERFPSMPPAGDQDR